MPSKEFPVIPISSNTNFQLKKSVYWIFEIPRFGGAGFTLIELLVAIAILAIVSAIGLTTYTNAQKVARDSKRQQDLRSVATALEIYYQSQATHSYPSGNWTNLATTLAAPTYINQMPSDPGSFSYTYTGTGTCAGNACTGFSLCARLENTAAPLGSGVVNTGTGCSGGTRYFYLTNP